MRTPQEILARIAVVKDRDFFGTETDDLLFYLDFEHAKSFLQPEATDEDWGKPSRVDPLEAATEYLEFAFEKCLGHRGLSAARSISHFKAWFWLAGDDDTLAFLEDESHYPNYGAPMLLKIANVLGVAAPEGEDFACMARGERCGVGDNCGCGQ